jgi:hypothetical protein
MLTGSPASPGLTGDRWFCVDNSTEVIDCTTEDQATLAAVRKAGGEQQNFLDGAKAILDIAALGDGSVRTLLRAYLSRPENVDETLDRIDLNGDGKWSLPEVLSPRGGREGEENALNDLYNDFLNRVEDNLDIGAGQENIFELPAVQRGDLTGRADLLASYDGVRLYLVLTYEGRPGVLHSILAKLKAAETAEMRGNLKAKQGALGAAVNEIGAQLGKNITPGDGSVLVGLIGLL